MPCHFDAITKNNKAKPLHITQKVVDLADMY